MFIGNRAYPNKLILYKKFLIKYYYIFPFSNFVYIVKISDPKVTTEKIITNISFFYFYDLILRVLYKINNFKK